MRTFAWSGMILPAPWDKKNANEMSPKYGQISYLGRDCEMKYLFSYQ